MLEDEDTNMRRGCRGQSYKMEDRDDLNKRLC